MNSLQEKYSFIKASEIKYINIEITTKCSLKCPMCPRTVFPEFLDLKHEMPLSTIKKITQIQNLSKIYICGANGEPTQHSDFLNIVKYLIENTNAQINFHTHGCFRSEAWWTKLLLILRPTDHIIFSIDGLEDTNHLYRVNSQWKQIEMAAKMSAKKVLTTWKYIVFSHNEHQIEKAISTAKEWGITWFSLKKSDRWTDAYRPNGAGEDWMKNLMPSNDFVTFENFDQNTVYNLSKKFNSAGNFKL